MYLADISIKRPIMMSMILLVFVLFGTLGFLGMKQELTPEMSLPLVNRSDDLRWVPVLRKWKRRLPKKSKMWYPQ